MPVETSIYSPKCSISHIIVCKTFPSKSNHVTEKVIVYATKGGSDATQYLSSKALIIKMFVMTPKPSLYALQFSI